MINQQNKKRFILGIFIVKIRAKHVNKCLLAKTLKKLKLIRTYFILLSPHLKLNTVFPIF